MNSLDIVLLLVLAGSVISGFMAGFTKVGIGFIAMVLGVLFGMWFYFVPAGWISDYVQSPTASNLIGFFVIFCAFIVLGGVIGAVLGRMLKLVGLSFFDRLGGAAFGFLRGAVVVVAMVTVITAFSPTPPPKVIVNSQVVPYAATAGSVLAWMAPRGLKDGFHDTMGKLKHVWQENDPRNKKKADGA